MSDGTKRAPPSSTFHALAGLTSGLTTSLLLQPADLLKTRLQQSPSRTRLLPTLRTIFTSPAPLRQLWRGTLPSTIRTSGGSALYFASLERLRRWMGAFAPLRLERRSSREEKGKQDDGSGKADQQQQQQQLTAAANLASGALARASIGYILMPITVLKVRYESSHYSSSYSALGLGGAARNLYALEGVRGFFAGAAATAVRDAPYAGLYVAGYEWTKRVLARLVVASDPDHHDGKSERGKKASTLATINFASGGLAATFATAATNPPDAVKTRLQLLPGKYRNGWVAARDMVKGEGWRCLFDGLGLRVARKALSSAIAWTVYEELVRRRSAGAFAGLG